jgi:CPA1 family monovalent cation:H+ antiporter
MLAFGPLLLLLVIAIAVVVASSRLRFPYTAALVLLGITIGFLGQQVPLLGLAHQGTSLFSPELFFYVLLPPIIFDAGLHIDFRLLRTRAPFILFLVFVGVLVTTLLTGFVVAWLVGIPILAALLLAAIVSPTDPIAVVDLFRRRQVPAELSTITESESLLNDATGVIAFVVILGVIGSGTWNVVGSVEEFAWLIVGGVAVGLLVAGGTYLLHRQLHDAAVETAVSIVAAYGSYLLASDIGASGIIAVAIAGIAVGTWVAPRTIAPEVRASVGTFWNVVVWVDNSMIFLAMGLLVAPSDIIEHLPLVLLVLAIIYTGRAAFVYVHRPLSRALVGPQAQLPTTWYNVLTLSGIRGAIPVVLALSLLTSSTSLSPGVVQTIVGVVVGVAAISVVGGNLAASAYVTRRFAPSAVAPDDPPP